MSGIKVIPPLTLPNLPIKAPALTEGPAKESFGDFLSNAVSEINQFQVEAGDAQDMLIRGDAAELHQVMIAGEKAGISFDLLLEIRKKLLEAYQDIIRMPV